MYPLLKRRKIIIFLCFLWKKGKSSEVQSAALYEGVQRWGIREDVDGIRWAAIASSVVGGNIITIHFVISQALELSRSQLHTYSSLRKSYREKETVSYRKPFKKRHYLFLSVLRPYKKTLIRVTYMNIHPCPHSCLLITYIITVRKPMTEIYITVIKTYRSSWLVGIFL